MKYNERLYYHSRRDLLRVGESIISLLEVRFLPSQWRDISSMTKTLSSSKLLQPFDNPGDPDPVGLYPTLMLDIAPFKPAENNKTRL